MNAEDSNQSPVAPTGSIESAEIDPTSAPKPDSRSHTFVDPRQGRIYERLRSIGPGPAGFFRDACFLVDRPELLVMSAHMVGHALRETESALRGVLCATFDVHEPDGDGKHRREIEALLKALELPLHDAAAQAWLGIPSKDSGLQAWAHRRNLGRRVLNEEFETLWDNVQLFLDVVLMIFERESVRAFDLADRLIAIDPPTDASIKSAMEDLINGVAVMDRFARNVPMSWFDRLLAAGYFDSPPLVTDLAEGASWEALRWPNVELLRRGVEHEATRDDAWAIIKRIGVAANPPLHVDLVEMALLGSPADAVRLVPLAKGWLLDGADFLLVDRLSSLVQFLVEGGEIDSGFDLSQALLNVSERPVS